MTPCTQDDELAAVHPCTCGISQDEFPFGETRIGELTVHRSPTSFRRSSTSEAGPRKFNPQPIDYTLPGQTFKNLYATVALMIQECGACSRIDLSIIPALSRYSAFQIERALITAEFHGLLKRVGSVPLNHPGTPSGDDPDEPIPGIYDIDPHGLIDRTSADATVRRAIATRYPFETAWMRNR